MHIISTRFTTDVDVDRLSNLAMWLDQELPFLLDDDEALGQPQSHGTRQVRFHVGKNLPEATLDELCRGVDACWDRILPDLEYTTSHRRGTRDELL